MAELGTTEALKAAPSKGRFSIGTERRSRGFLRGRDSLANPAPRLSGDRSPGRHLDGAGDKPKVSVMLHALDADDPQDLIHIQFGEATSAHEGYKRKKFWSGVKALVAGVTAAVTAWAMTTLASAAAVAGFEGGGLIVGALSALLWPLFLVAVAVTIFYAGRWFYFRKAANSSEVILHHPAQQ